MSLITSIALHESFLKLCEIWKSEQLWLLGNPTFLIALKFIFYYQFCFRARFVTDSDENNEFRNIPLNTGVGSESYDRKNFYLERVQIITPQKFGLVHQVCCPKNCIEHFFLHLLSRFPKCIWQFCICLNLRGLVVHWQKIQKYSMTNVDKNA